MRYSVRSDMKTNAAAAVVAAQGADDLLALHVGLGHLAGRLVGHLLALGIDRRLGIGGSHRNG